MKCDNCKNQKLEIGIISGLYCVKGHWDGVDSNEDPEEDPWENCEDYKLCSPDAMNHPKHVNKESQEELAAMIIADGEDPEAWRCRTCGAIYDGGQFCTYCGDHNPLDDPEM